MRSLKDWNEHIQKGMPLLEAIPNISEGRNTDFINTCKEAIERRGATLLNTDIGLSANRTVFTIIGSPEDVFNAIDTLYNLCSLEIDMKKHEGNHPRIGAVDVCPFVPLANYSLKEAKADVDGFGKKIAEKYTIPLYFYEYSAKNNERINLAAIRKGDYVKFEERMIAGYKPDAGPEEFNPKFGASVMGVRDFLIAINFSVEGDDLKAVKSIASEIRESGRRVRNADGTFTQKKGKLKGVKAIGWYVEEYGQAQVSVNITRPYLHSLDEVFSEVKTLCIQHRMDVMASELIGMIPKAALQRREEITSEKDLTEYYLLNKVKHFHPDEHVLENALGLVNYQFSIKPLTEKGV